MLSTRHYKKKTLLKKSKNVKLTRKYKKSKIHKTRINKLKGGGVYSEEEILNFHKKIDEFKTLDDIDKALKNMEHSLSNYQKKTSKFPLIDTHIIPHIIDLLNNRKEFMTILKTVDKTSDPIPIAVPILEAKFKKIKEAQLSQDHIRYFQLLGNSGVPNYSINYFEFPNKIMKFMTSMLPKDNINNNSNTKKNYKFKGSIPIINIKEVQVIDKKLVINMKDETEPYILDPTHTNNTIDLDMWVDKINSLKKELELKITLLNEQKDKEIEFIMKIIERSNEIIKVRQTAQQNEIDKEAEIEAEIEVQRQKERNAQRAKANAYNQGVRNKIREENETIRAKWVQQEKKFKAQEKVKEKEQCVAKAREIYSESLDKCGLLRHKNRPNNSL